MWPYALAIGVGLIAVWIASYDSASEAHRPLGRVFRRKVKGEQFKAQLPDVELPSGNVTLNKIETREIENKK